MESYRLIIDSTNAIGNDSSQARPETFERMVQAAQYGVQALDAAAKRVASDIPVEARERDAENADGAAKVPQVRSTHSYTSRLCCDCSTIDNTPQMADSHPVEGQTCLGCSATSTPEWRRGPMGA